MSALTVFSRVHAHRAAVLWIALAVATAAAPAEAVVTQLDNWRLASSTNPNGTTINVTATNQTVSAGSQRLLVVAAVLEAGGSGTMSNFNANFGGVAMTPIASTESLSQREGAKAWYLLDADILSGARILTVTGSHQQTVSGLHIYWGSFSGVDQANPIVSANGNAAGSPNVTFGAQINYVADGLGLLATGNGSTGASLNNPADFATVVTTNTNGHSSFISQTGNYATSGSYPASTTVSYSGSTSSRSAVVVATLRSGNVNPTTAGTVTAAQTPGATPSIAVSAPYTGDANNNNSLSYRYRLSGGTYGAPTNLPHSASPYAFTIANLTCGANYDVEVTYVDSPDGVNGTNPQTVSNVALTNCSTAGSATAAQTPGATPSIAVSFPYAQDADGDNALSYRIRLSGGSYGAPVAVPHSASPYAFTIASLTCGSSYDLELTLADAHGVSGTAVQTLSNLPVDNCTSAGTVGATGGSCGSISATASYLFDANGDNSLSYRYRTPSGTGAWSAPAAVPHAASPYAFDITGLAAGSYDVEVTYVDADAVSGSTVQSVTNVTVSATCTAAGTVTLVPTSGSCTSLTLTAPYTGDSGGGNSPNTLSYRYRTPPGTGGWSAPVNLAHAASPYVVNLGGLTAVTAYEVEVTYVDANGVSGVNPQTVIATTGDCRVAPELPTAVANACDQVTISAPFTGDADLDSTTTVRRGTAPGGPYPTTVCAALAGASPRTCIDSTVAASSTYYYQVDFTDPDTVVGTNPQEAGPVTTPACAQVSTTAGTAFANVAGCHQLNVIAPYTGDADRDGSITVEYNTSNSWPGTTACTLTGLSPRACQVTGLTPSTTYWVRVTYADPDGVIGTPVQVLPGSYTTNSCGGNNVGPMVVFLSPARGSIVGGVERFRVQVYDPDGMHPTNPMAFGIDTPTPGATGFVVNSNYACNFESQTQCRVYEFDVDTRVINNGGHYMAVRATDAIPNNSEAAWGFTVANSGSVPTGSGTILRRTEGAQICIDCHNLGTHSSQAIDFDYGSWGFDCLTCHTPHQTRNVFLVREEIDTPHSGRKTVDFRSATGVGANAHATPQASGVGVNVCEVCHTQTRNSDGTPRARNNAATDWTKHYTSACTGCHGHGRGFAAGESSGGTTCSGCHSDIWNNMQTGSTKVSKHRLAIDTFTDDSVVWPPTGGGGTLAENLPAARSCVNMCHEDHPHTLTSPATTTHENNVYLDATSNASRAATTRTSADKDKTDFEGVQANGGMCVSCHRNAVDATHPAIDKAGYDASAHDYTSFSTYGAWTYTLHDGSTFARNCTKCHSDGDAAPNAGTIPFGAVHWSDYPSLLSGSTNPNNVPATFVCYSCHGNGTTGTDRSGKNIASQIAKTRNHPANADNVHVTVTEFNNAAFGNTLGVAGRHANCLDCHDGHRAKPGGHTTPGSVAAPSLEGAWGAELTTSPAFWSDTAAGSFTKKTIVAGTDVEATLCFKCHTRYYWGNGTPPTSPSGGFAETDVAKEFNPNNVGNFAGTWANGETAGGFHPILASAGSNLGAINLANLVTTNLPWSTGTRNRMTCTDCHESDTVTDPGGPHGSTAGFILRGPNTGWSATTTQTSSGMPAGTFCANCHAQNFSNSRFTQHFSRSDHRIACWNCHAAVPHGGPRPGMLIAPAGANANVGGTITGWDTTSPYWGLGTSNSKLYLVSYPANNTTAWNQNNCGCNGTGH